MNGSVKIDTWDQRKFFSKGEHDMDAIIGRYRASMEDTGMLLLQHPAGIAFDLTAEEVLELLDFLQVYQKTLLMLTRQTDAQLKSVVVEKGEEQNSKA